MGLEVENFKILSPYERIDRTDLGKSVGGSKAANTAEKGTGKTFEDALQELKDQRGIVFSKHAKQRLAQRGIELDGNDLEQLNQAVNEAEEKGVKTVAVVLQKGVLIADAKSKTIITVTSNGDDGQGQFFTNVNGVAVRF